MGNTLYDTARAAPVLYISWVTPEFKYIGNTFYDTTGVAPVTFLAHPRKVTKRMMPRFAAILIVA
jgi:hypothetical protein